MKKISIATYKNNKSLVSLSPLFFNPIDDLNNTESDLFICSLSNKPNTLIDKTCSKGNNLLHYALMVNSPYAGNIALQCPRLVNQKNVQGQLPIHFASFHKNINLLDFYPSKGIALTDDRGFTPLHIAAERGIINHLAPFKTLINQGNIFDALPLHWVMKNQEVNPETRVNKLIMAKHMLQLTGKKNCINVRNAIGMSPIDWMESSCSSKEIDFIFQT